MKIDQARYSKQGISSFYFCNALANKQKPHFYNIFYTSAVVFYDNKSN